MKRMISLIMVIAILSSSILNYGTVYAASSELNDYEKEILNAYMRTISHIGLNDINGWSWYEENIMYYSYEGIKYDFENQNEEKLSFKSGTLNRLLYTSFEKRYDNIKKMDYIVVNGIFCLEDYDNPVVIENVHQSPPGGTDDWGVASLPEITLYRVTLGVYIKEVDGNVYAYGEKYKYKDISAKDIVTPEELTEGEYINLASYIYEENKQGGISVYMEDMYGLKNPTIKKYKEDDIYLIPINNKKSSGGGRYFPVGNAEGYRFILSFG